MANKVIELISPYTPEECAKRIQTATEKWLVVPMLLLMNPHPKPVASLIKNDSIILRRILLENGLPRQTSYRLSAKIKPCAQGSLISYQCGVSSILLVFSPIWAVLFILYSLTEQEIKIKLALVAMALFPVLLVFINRWIGQRDSRFLADFLCKTIDAKPQN